MGGKHSRDKGHNWEREVAYDHLKPLFGEAVRRGRQTREGSDEADVVLPDAAPFWVECQCAARCDFRGKLKQAGIATHRNFEVTGKTKIPVAFLKETHKGKPGTVATPPIVAMYMPDFLWLLGEWWRSQQK